MAYFKMLRSGGEISYVRILNGREITTVAVDNGHVRGAVWKACLNFQERTQASLQDTVDLYQMGMREAARAVEK